ncbi:MAG: hypothetical protein RBT63_03685 [Bdellovibrionales bacterium]|nr:hypothetical protein [Bdellovibrionales bacterium]
MKLVRFIFNAGLVTSLILFAGAACSSQDKGATPSPTAHGKSSGDWSGSMQELSMALNKLLPLVSDSKAFNDPKNESVIKESTSRLKKLSHQVRELEKPAADPAYESIARMLDEDLARAVVALHTGNRDYARLTIRESIGYCIQCHTQTAGGPSFPKLDLGFDPSKLSPLAQGDYYAATRQFDTALEAYQKGIKDASYAKKDVFGWERAARSGLAIAVRFKESPKESAEITKAIIRNPSATESLKDNAKAWDKAIAGWAKEKPSNTKNKNARLERAEKLVKEATALLENDESARNQDILFLRASADLHKWLSENPLSKTNAANRAKALYLAGRSAEESRELNFWTLHERYYELCIDTLPKSAQAQNCFKSLNESVLMGYTGSSGLHLPPDETARLARLKAKAFGP